MDWNQHRSKSQERKPLDRSQQGGAIRPQSDARASGSVGQASPSRVLDDVGRSEEKASGALRNANIGEGAVPQGDRLTLTRAPPKSRAPAAMQSSNSRPVGAPGYVNSTNPNRFPLLESSIIQGEKFKGKKAALVGLGRADGRLPPQVGEVTGAVARSGGSQLDFFEFNKGTVDEMRSDKLQGELKKHVGTRPLKTEVKPAQDIADYARQFRARPEGEEKDEDRYHNIISTQTLMYPLKSYQDEGKNIKEKMKRSDKKSKDHKTDAEIDADVEAKKDELLTNMMGMLHHGGSMFIDQNPTYSMWKSSLQRSGLVTTPHVDRNNSTKGIMEIQNRQQATSSGASSGGSPATAATRSNTSPTTTPSGRTSPGRIDSSSSRLATSTRATSELAATSFTAAAKPMSTILGTGLGRSLEARSGSGGPAVTSPSRSARPTRDLSPSRPTVQAPGAEQTTSGTHAPTSALLGLGSSRTQSSRAIALPPGSVASETQAQRIRRRQLEAEQRHKEKVSRK